MEDIRTKSLITRIKYVDSYVCSLSYEIDKMMEKVKSDAFSADYAIDLYTLFMDYVDMLDNMRDILVNPSNLRGFSLSVSLKKLLDHIMMIDDKDNISVLYSITPEKKKEVNEQNMMQISQVLSDFEEAKNGFMDGIYRYLMYTKAIEYYLNSLNNGSDALKEKTAEIAEKLDDEANILHFLIDSIAICYIGYMSIFDVLKDVNLDLSELGFMCAGRSFVWKVDVSSIVGHAENIIGSNSDLHPSLTRSLSFVKYSIDSDLYDMIKHGVPESDKARVERVYDEFLRIYSI